MRWRSKGCAAAVLTFGLIMVGPAAAAADPVVDAVGDSACTPGDANYNGGNGVPNAVYPAHNCRQKAVSDLVVSAMPTALLDLGDNQYDNGELGNYETVYDASFGRANSVVYPGLGNAEYANGSGTTASGFFGYFGADTGVMSRITHDGGDNTNLTSGGYYSLDLGAWHIISLNSNCANITGGCGTGSPEEKWLKADLAAHPGVCTLAYWHHPRWNSGNLGNDPATQAFWDDLYAARADVVLNGHGNHHYERFAPQDNHGNPTPSGIREFIASTGGQSHGQPPASPGDTSTSEVTNYSSFGILQLTLHATSFDWRFVPDAGTFLDTGTGTCHSAAASPSPTFPATPVLDSFTQPSGALSSRWQTPALQDPGVVSVASNGTTAGSTATSSATWKATTFNADQQAYLTVPTLPTAGHSLQLGGRVSTLTASTVSMYFVRVTPSTGTWELRKKLNGAASTSMGTFTAPLAAGDSIGLDLNGTTITAYHGTGSSWTAVGSVTDGAISTGGYLTFSLGDTTARGGAVGGGNSTGTSPRPPPTVSTDSASSVGTTSANVAGTVNPNGQATTYRFDYGTSSRYGSRAPSPPDPTAGSGTADQTESAGLSGLSPGTTYHYRLQATNASGTTFGSDRTFTTGGSSPPPPTFPATPVLDSFTQPSGALSSRWQTPALQDPGVVSVASNGTTAGSTATSSATWKATTFNADQQAYLTVPTLPTAGHSLQLGGRVSTLTASTVSMYFVRVTPSTGTWELRKKLNGAASTSMGTFTAPLAAGDSIGLDLNGTTITAYHGTGSSWTAVGSVTDGAISTGGYLTFSLGDTTARGGAVGGGNSTGT